MGQEVTFGFRTSVKGRQELKAVAQRLKRTESDTIRLLVREVARELGVIPEAGSAQQAGGDSSYDKPTGRKRAA